MKKLMYPITALLVATSLLTTGCDNHVQMEALAKQKGAVEEVVDLQMDRETKTEESIQKEEGLSEDSLSNYEYKARDLWVVKIYNPLTKKEEYYIMTHAGYSYELDDEKAKEEKTNISKLINIEDNELQIDKGSYFSADFYTSIFNENIKVRECTTVICCWNEIALCDISKNLFTGEELSGHYGNVFAVGIEPTKNFKNNYYKDAEGVHTMESDYVLEQSLLYDYYGCKPHQIFFIDELEAMERELNESNTFTYSR